MLASFSIVPYFRVRSRVQHLNKMMFILPICPPRQLTPISVSTKKMKCFLYRQNIKKTVWLMFRTDFLLCGAQSKAETLTSHLVV